jgi:hypothetical protein
MYPAFVAGLAANDLQRALDAAVAGDLNRLVSMFDAQVDWRGPEHGHWLWRRAPS